MIRRIYSPQKANSCFFRSTVEPPDIKIMLQITEKCNMNCEHCFVKSTKFGKIMHFESIKNIILPIFVSNNVKKVTLTGGEPLTHPNIKEIIHLFLENNISVSVCTNGLNITYDLIKEFSKLNNLHYNVSLDGLRLETHGKFRAIDTLSRMTKIINNIEMLGQNSLLNGVLTTPNIYTSVEEYVELCKFAKDNNAKYVLMNPLSPFGRGEETQKLAYSRDKMIELKKKTEQIITSEFEIVYIRFPNIDNSPISSCFLGRIPYVFCNGDVAICPYMAFAAASKTNKYKYEDFILGNILKQIPLKNCITEYLEIFNSKYINSEGCFAAKIANDISLNDGDNFF